ncbi:hypothetical protein DFH09DRAFT_1072348 [Mycena vulgaris]|nr:hypothetical protein DFH09DRAFT_1072348 [Mycena vulgaris]
MPRERRGLIWSVPRGTGSAGTAGCDTRNTRRDPDESEGSDPTASKERNMEGHPKRSGDQQAYARRREQSANVIPSGTFERSVYGLLAVCKLTRLEFTWLMGQPLPRLKMGPDAPETENWAPREYGDHEGSKVKGAVGYRRAGAGISAPWAAIESGKFGIPLTLSFSRFLLRARTKGPREKFLRTLASPVTGRDPFVTCAQITVSVWFPF